MVVPLNSVKRIESPRAEQTLDVSRSVITDTYSHSLIMPSSNGRLETSSLPG